MKRFRTLLGLAVVCGVGSSSLTLAQATAPAAKFVVSPDHADGIYHVGDTVHWTARWTGTEADRPAKVRYLLKRGGQKEVGAGELTFTGATAVFESTFDAPNSMLAVVQWGDLPGQKTDGGAVAEPFAIQPAVEEPADFDAFWRAKLDKLKAIPPNAQLTPQDAAKPGVRYEKITLDGINGTHVQGQIARPEKAEKLPAILIPQYAGVYPLQKPWVTNLAANGWLAMNIEAHDMPIDNPPDYYKQLAGPGGPLLNYWKIGNTDKNTSYYLRMYLSVAQSITYLKSRPDWDGKTLVVMGASQGGQQTLMAAGLCNESVTAALAFLPAACDNWAESIGRHSGFPFWWNQVDNRDAGAVRETSKYFDPVYFARRIKCPVLVGVALRDDLAPPSSVFAAYNQIVSPKQIVILPTAGHQDEQGSQAAYGKVAHGQWLKELVQGRPAPTTRPAN